MTFLPIVERELRLAARKRGTFWLREVAALVALVIGGVFFLIASAFPGGQVSLGAALFSTLTWLSLAVALSAGLFFTSDCLSEEKREGTLGFLFLTDLRGYDVVLGKLAATSLRCGFAMLAIFPVLAITQLMGGVEAGLFWKTLLALTHALFFSLAAGMLVSSVSRDGQRALLGTLGLLIFFLGAGPALDGALALVGQSSFRPRFSLASPGYVFVRASGWGGFFWPALLTSQAVAWLMLGLSCVLIPRTWQQKSAKSSPVVMRGRYWWRYGGSERRAALRRKLLEVNPVLWLVARERWQGFVIWVVVALMFGVFVATMILDASAPFWVWRIIGSAALPVLYLWMALQASEFFAEARRTGLIELLLVAPLSPAEIVQGPWRALVRLFAWPFGVCLTVGLAAQLYQYLALNFWQAIAVAGGSQPAEWFQILRGLAETLVTLANLAALGWFGLWMGLTSRNARWATLKTLVWVLFVPALLVGGLGILVPVLSLAAVGIRQSATGNNFTLWYPVLGLVVTTVSSLGKDAFFIWLARRKLLGDFRKLALPALTKLHSPFLPPIIAAKP